MKFTHDNSSQEKGKNAIIQYKKQSSFIKSKDDRNRFSPPKTTNSSTKKLPNSLQFNLESSLHQDFSSVSIHTNSQEAVQMNARAYTQGENIHFAPGAFNPNSTSGQHLIGHEFVHVAQQRAGIVKPTTTLQKGISVNNNSSLEQEADTYGKKAVSGETVSKYKGHKAASSEVMQRKIMIEGVTAPLRYAFVDKINEGSEMAFEMNTLGLLKQKYMPQVPNNEYERVITNGIHAAETVRLQLVNESDTIFIDEFISGKVDIDDLMHMSTPVFQSSFLHFLMERFAIQDYELKRGNAKNADFNFSHNEGIISQEIFLREQYPKKNIMYTNRYADPNSKVVDAAGNGTIDYIIDFTDVRYVYTQPIQNGATLENVVNSRIDIVR